MEKHRGPFWGTTAQLLPVVLLALIATVLIPSHGLAQQYLGFYAGGAVPVDGTTVARERFSSDLSAKASADNVNLSGLNVSLPETEFDMGLILGARAGYWFENLNSPFLGVEAEIYGAFPKISDQNLQMSLSGNSNGTNGAATVTVPVEEADLTIVNVGFNLLARYPYGNIQPYAGVGVGIFTGFLDDVKLKESATVTIAGSSFTLDQGDFFFKEDKQTEPALQLIGGVRGFLSDNVAIFAEYKYVKTELEFQSMQIDYDASNIYAGVEFYFGPGGGVSRPRAQALRSPLWPP